MKRLTPKQTAPNRRYPHIVLWLCAFLMIAGCSGSDSEARSFTDFEHIEAEYLETIDSKRFITNRIVKLQLL